MVIDATWLKGLLLRLLLWVVAAISLPFLLDTVQSVKSLMPYYYAACCVFLFAFFELSLFLFRRRCYFYYLLSLALAYFAFTHLADFLAMLDLGYRLDDLMRLQRLRVNYVSQSMFRFVVAVSVVYHLYVLHRERQEMMKAKLEAELTMLKSQITPHFFFNSLNSIYSLSLAKDDRALDAIITLSDMMRYVLTDAKADWIDLEQELTYLDRYVELQRLRLPNQTKLDYKVEMSGNHRIPPMLLITFLENAFKYGASSQNEEKISIHLAVEDNTLCLATHNAIVVAKKKSNSTGNGIANARRRLELVYPNCHDLLICESNGYYQLKLTIQLS